MRLEQSIRDFYEFLCNPTFNYKFDKPDSYKNLSIMLAMLFLLNIFAAAMIFSVLGLDDTTHKMEQMLKELPIWIIFGFAVIMAPLFEEFVFRGFLRYPASLIGIISGIIIGLACYLKFVSLINWIVFGVMVLIATMLFIYLLQSKINIDRVRRFFIKYFGVIFYTTVVIFAFVHITNFTEVAQWYWTPLLVMPQFILGLFLGYVRVRNNLWASICMHALNNAVPMTLLLFNPELANM